MYRTGARARRKSTVDTGLEEDERPVVTPSVCGIDAVVFTRISYTRLLFGDRRRKIDVPLRRDFRGNRGRPRSIDAQWRERTVAGALVWKEGAKGFSER